MKKQLLAIMNENGKYLTEFKTRTGNVLSFEAGWNSEFQHGLTVDWDVVKDDEENTEGLKRWAKILDGELVVIEIDYQVKELDSGELRDEYSAKSIKSSEGYKEFEKMMDGILGINRGGNDDE